MKHSNRNRGLAGALSVLMVFSLIVATPAGKTKAAAATNPPGKVVLTDSLTELESAYLNGESILNPPGDNNDSKMFQYISENGIVYHAKWNGNKYSESDIDQGGNNWLRAKKINDTWTIGSFDWSTKLCITKENDAIFDLESLDYYGEINNGLLIGVKKDGTLYEAITLNAANKEQKTVESNWKNIKMAVVISGNLGTEGAATVGNVKISVPAPDLLAYEGFKPQDHVSLPAKFLGTATDSFGWNSTPWRMTNGQDFQTVDFGIRNDRPLYYGTNSKKLNISPEYLEGGATYINPTRTFDVNDVKATDYTYDTTYKKNTSDLGTAVKAYGKPGTTLWFSGLMYASNLSFEEDRWITFCHGKEQGLDSSGTFENGRFGFGTLRNQGGNNFGIYVIKDKGDGTNERVQQFSSVNYRQKDATFFVLKLDYKANGKTDISAYVNPELDGQVPQQASMEIKDIEDNLSFDRIFMNFNATFMTSFDEFKLGTSYQSVVDIVDGGVPAEKTFSANKEALEDQLLIEDNFDYPEGPLARKYADTPNAGGFGWKNDTSNLNNMHNFAWVTDSTNENGAKSAVTESNPLLYPGLVSSPSHFTPGTLSGNKDPVYVGRMFECDPAKAFPEAANYLLNGTTVKYYGAPGKDIWLSALVRINELNYDNTLDFDIGRWGFPWQSDGPTIRLGKARWTSDSKTKWNFYYGNENAQQKCVTTSKDVVEGETVLAVIKVEPYSMAAGKVSLYLNPELNKVPQTPDASINVDNYPVLFRQMTITSSTMDVDAVRLGTTFGAVLPVKSYRYPVTKVRIFTDDINKVIGGKLQATSIGQNDQYVTLGEVPSNAQLNEDGYYDLTVTNRNAYKYIRFQTSDGFAKDNASHIQFFSHDRRMYADSNKDSVSFNSGEAVSNTFTGMNLGGKDAAAEPAANVPSTEFAKPQYKNITLTTSTSGAKIYYTTDGSDPVAGNENTKEYTAAIGLVPGDEVTIKSIAVKDGLDDSVVTTLNYKIPAYDYPDPYVINGNFETLTDNGGIYGWDVWSASLDTTGGINGSAGLKVGGNSGGAVSAPQGKIPVSNAGKTFVISAEIKELQAATNTESLMLKVHAKGDLNGNKEPAKEAGKMFLVNKDTFAGKTGFVKIEQTVVLLSESEISDLANPYFRLELWNGSDGEYMIDNIRMYQKCSVPVIRPDEKANADEPLEVSITADTGDDIYYTTDGSVPTKESAKYTDKIQVGYGESKNIKAIAYADNKYTSDVAAASYSVKAKLEKVTFSPEAGTFVIEYGTKKDITLAGPEGADIYYTLDGTEPTASGTKYTSPIELSAGTVTVKAIAVKEGWVNSDPVSAAYIIQIEDVAKPTVKLSTVITQNTAKISGTATKGAQVTVKMGSKSYTGTASASTGKWTVTVKKASVGTKVVISSAFKGKTSNAINKKVIPSAATISKVTTKSKSIKGKTAFAKVKITIKIGGKTYQVKATGKKTYTLKLKKKLKKKTKITVYYTYKNIKSVPANRSVT